jgi:hypothetical protein
MPYTVFYAGQHLHSPWATGWGSCIIHVFFFFLIMAVPTAVFRFTVGLFTLLGLTIFSLGFTMIFALSCDAAFIATVGLSSPATPTDTKNQITPPASDYAQ